MSKKNRVAYLPAPHQRHSPETATEVTHYAHEMGLLFTVFMSGCAALTAQQAWFHLMRIMLGGTTAAGATSSAAYLTGFAIGAWYFGTRAHLNSSPGNLFASLLANAGWALLGSLLLAMSASALSPSLPQALVASWLEPLVSFLLALFAIALPTVFLGGIIPVACRLSSGSGRSSSPFAALAAADFLGAAFGTLITGYVLLEMIGARMTMTLAAVLLIVLGKWYNPGGPDAGETLPRARDGDEERIPVQSPGAPFWLFAAFLDGMLTIIIQSAWLRLLSPILGGTIYVFSAVTSCCILGYGLGSACVSFFPCHDDTRRVRRFSMACLGTGACLAFGFALGDRPALLSANWFSSTSGSFLALVTGHFLIVGLVTLPSCIASGFILPLIIECMGGNEKDLSRRAGSILSWNGIGSILGALFIAFGLLPWLSAPQCWRLVSLTFLFLGGGTLLGVIPAQTESRKLLAPVTLAGLTLLLLSCPGPGVLWRHSYLGSLIRVVSNSDPVVRQDWLAAAQRRITWHSEGREAGVALADSHGLAFLQNGNCDGNIVQDTPMLVMLGMIGAMRLSTIHGKAEGTSSPPQTGEAFVVGMGTGCTAGWLGQAPFFRHVTVCELGPETIDVARRCSPANRSVLENPRVKTIFGDARHVLRRESRQFALIVSGPSNLAQAGTALLFTRDFYRVVASRLAPNGVFTQWLQGQEMTIPMLATVFATLREVFPSIEIWDCDPTNLLVVCSQVPLVSPQDQARSLLQEEIFRDALWTSWMTDSPEGILSHYVGGNQTARRLGEFAPGINTEDRPILEFAAARQVGQTGADTVASLWKAAEHTGSSALLISLERLSSYTRARRAIPPAALPSPLPASRLDAHRRFLSQDAAGVLRGLEGIPTTALTHFERLIRAEALAATGHEEALVEAQHLQTLLPIEANLILALHAFQTGSSERTAAFLANAFQLMQLRRVHCEPMVERGLRLAELLCSRLSPLPNSLVRALEKPFFGDGFNDQRRLVAIEAANAGALPASESWALLAPFESHLPWNEPFLEKRLRIYRRTNHPLAEAAGRDLAEFRSLRH